MAKKDLHKLYIEYKKIKGYSDGGNVKNDSETGRFLASVRQAFGNTESNDQKTPEQINEEKKQKIRQQNIQNMGYASGGEVQDPSNLSPEEFQQHLENLKAQGYKIQEPVGGDPQLVTGLRGPASEESIAQSENPDDKAVEDPYKNEELAANADITNDEADDEETPITAESVTPAPKAPTDQKTPEIAQKAPETEQPAFSRLVSSLKPGTTSNDLAEAQKQRDSNIALNQFQRGAAIMGGGLAKTDPNMILKAIDSQEKYVGMPVQKYEEQIANQKNDPNSNMSKVTREYLRQKHGVNIPETSSYADIEKVAAYALKDAGLENAIKKVITQQAGAEKRAQEHISSQEKLAGQKSADYNARTSKIGELSKNRLSDKEQRDIDNDFTKLEKRLTSETASSRSAFGKAANVSRSADAIEALIQQSKNPNDLDNRQIKELARNLDSMLANGASTVSGSAGLVPRTSSGDASKIEEYVLNIPKGAGQGAFVKRMLDTVQRERQVSQKQIATTQGKVLSAYSHLKKKAPDRYNEMLSTYGLSPDAKSVPAIDADLSKMSPDELKAYIKAHGG